MSKLKELIQQGNLEEVRKIVNISNYSKIEAIEGNTLLFYAIKFRKAPLVKYFVKECQAKTNEVIKNDKSKLTALHLAALVGDVEIIKELLDAKADDIEAKSTIDGDTPLLVAVLYGHADAAKFLIEKGADLNATNNQGHTALMSSVKKGNVDIVRHLLALRKSDKNPNGYDINLETKSKDSRCTALNLAAGLGNVEIIKALIDAGADKETKGYGGMTTLFQASLFGRVEAAKFLIEKGADTNVKTSSRSTLLMMASRRNGKVEMVRYLLELRKNGYDIELEAQDNVKDTALHYAAQDNKVEIMEELIAAGADKEAKNAKGETPLISAVVSGHAGAAKLLIEKGAASNVKNLLGKDTLMVAAEAGKVELVKQLLDVGVACNEIKATEEIKLHIDNAKRADNLYYNGNPCGINDFNVNVNVERFKYLCRIDGYPTELTKHWDQIIIEKQEKLAKLQGHIGQLSQIQEQIETLKKLKADVDGLQKEILTSQEKLAQNIEANLALLLKKLYPDEFPSISPYSALKINIRQKLYAPESSSGVSARTLRSYESKPFFRPIEFIKAMLNPEKREDILTMFYQVPEQADAIFFALEGVVLEKDKHKNLRALEKEYKSVSQPLKIAMGRMVGKINELSQQLNRGSEAMQYEPPKGQSSITQFFRRSVHKVSESKVGQDSLVGFEVKEKEKKVPNGEIRSLDDDDLDNELKNGEVLKHPKRKQSLYSSSELETSSSSGGMDLRDLKKQKTTSLSLESQGSVSKRPHSAISPTNTNSSSSSSSSSIAAGRDSDSTQSSSTSTTLSDSSSSSSSTTLSQSSSSSVTGGSPKRHKSGVS